MPRAMREMDRVRSGGIRFAHYTSAETGLKILRSCKMLLRNSSLMNDFSEVQHGMECLNQAYNGKVGDRLKVAINEVQAELPEILQANFNEQFSHINGETYLMSVSEHDAGHEDDFGRLSMWRAYAPKDGVAFILNNTAFMGESDALGAFTSPVFYCMPDEFLTSFEEVVSSIEQNIELLQSLGGRFVHDTLLRAFRFAVQSTKHPSFSEEREWRVIYAPTLADSDGYVPDQQSIRIPAEIMSLGGVPQRVFAIPFRDYPEEGFTGATPAGLINRVLIGPSRDSLTIGKAFAYELAMLGVEDAYEKVRITGVPLRH